MTSLVEADAVAIPGRLVPASFTLAAGTMVALVGPNGGGKTSLLRALAQVEEAVGAVTVGGERLAEVSPNRRSRLVGFLPASRELAWPIAVRDLVRLGLPARTAVDDVLAQLELTELAERRVDRLSTGERSRALIGRLLAAASKLLLLDEPLSNLDPYWVRQLTMGIRKTVSMHHSTAVVSVHDLSMIGSFDRTIVVAGGEIAFDGTPEEFVDGPLFEQIFRISPALVGVSRSADRRSSP